MILFMKYIQLGHNYSHICVEADRVDTKKAV